MIDILLLLVFAGVTWVVASEGAWGAALISLIVIFSGLLAMNFFEPLAVWLDGAMGGGEWGDRADVISLVGLFAGFVMLFRVLTEKMTPTYMDNPPMVFEIGRWGFGALAGYVCMAFLLTALHTAPLPREFMGFTPERQNLFSAAAPDRQWLGYTQYASEKVFSQGGNNRIFDGPRIQMGDPNTPHPNDIWPSFPIRYASRRATFDGSAQAQAPPPPAPRPSTKSAPNAPAF